MGIIWGQSHVGVIYPHYYRDYELTFVRREWNLGLFGFHTRYESLICGRLSDMWIEADKCG